MIKLKQIRTVYAKELLDGVRDRRAMFTAIIIPLLSPLLTFFLFNALIDIKEDLLATELNIKGAEYAPDLVEFIRQANITVAHFEGDAEQAIIDKSQSIILEIPEDYSQEFSRSKTVSIKLLHDSSRLNTVAEYNRALVIVNNYSQSIAAMRVIARGIRERPWPPIPE